MKRLKLILVIMAAAMITMGLTGMAYAFHSGAAAECGGCHSMHSPAQRAGNSLLIEPYASSTCLSCHAQPDTAPTSYHIMTYPVPGTGLPPVERTPGGDFAWLKKDYTFIVRGSTINELGQTHGHNVVAPNFGLDVDTDNAIAPGGTYPSSQLSCTSCHSAHGSYRRLSDGTISTTGASIRGSGSYNNSIDPGPGEAVGVYRILAGKGYVKVDFPGVPDAVTPSSYNRTEATTQTRVAYGYEEATSGHTSWGKWCATCHTDMHTASGRIVHPVDEGLGLVVKQNYDAYVHTGKLDGNNSTAYLSLVPFIENTSNYSVLKSHAKNDDSFRNGPDTNDQVSCLSCHRAHASGWEYALRWNMEGEFITYADASGNAVWPGTDSTPTVPQFARGRLSAETKAAYYDRNVTVFGAYQRVLCNKCHTKD